ncbi:probable beta-1,4-xylosyltransferase IRX10L [Tanacetum coccineum]
MASCYLSPRMMRSAIQLISSNWPYWNRTEGLITSLLCHMVLVPVFIIKYNDNNKELRELLEVELQGP